MSQHLQDFLALDTFDGQAYDEAMQNVFNKDYYEVCLFHDMGPLAATLN